MPEEIDDKVAALVQRATGGAAQAAAKAAAAEALSRAARREREELADNGTPTSRSHGKRAASR